MQLFTFTMMAILFFPLSLAVAEDAQELNITSKYSDSSTEITNSLVTAQAERESWCDRPLPVLKKGEVAVVWTKDSAGICNKTSMVVGK